MVLLLERLGHSLKFHSKLENHHHHHHLFHFHHHHQPEALSASLEAFRSHVSNSINHLLSNSQPESETLSLSRIQHCFELFPMINEAFTKLLVDIEYPFSKWEADSVEEYLNYSLNLLDLLNSISSSVSHLGQSRLSLSHAVSLVESSPSLAIERLKPIEPPGSFIKDGSEVKKGKDGEERSYLGQELVIHQALMVLKSIGFWVCGIILSSLSADHHLPYLELNKLTKGLENSSLIGLNSSVCGEIMAKIGVLKEVNDAVACLVDSMVSAKSGKKAEELGRRLELLENLLEGVGKQVDHLFAEVLAGRNKLLDRLRLQHKQ